MPRPLPVSILDVSPVPSGATPAQALHNSIDLAVFAERVGLARHWVAEHHNAAGLASSAPEVLMAALAAATSTLRIGSGGIMLPNHSPLKVAETFRVLHALHPGRIDLGLGRAPGTDARTALALRRSKDLLRMDDFPTQLDTLVELLTHDPDPRTPFGPMKAIPVGVPAPDLWILGSSGGSLMEAAQRGLGFAFAHHLNPEGAVETMRSYRRAFQPSRFRREPASILALSVVCAPTDDEAETLASSLDLAWVRFGQGLRDLPLPSVEEAHAHGYDETEEAFRRANRTRHLVGGVTTVATRIRELADACEADEVMALVSVHDHEARKRSYELLQRALA